MPYSVVYDLRGNQISKLRPIPHGPVRGTAHRLRELGHGHQPRRRPASGSAHIQALIVQRSTTPVV